MNARYAQGEAYAYELLWDDLRTQEIHATIRKLASHSGGVPRDTGLTLDIGCGNRGIAAHWPHQNIVGLEISSVAAAQYTAQYPGMECVVSPIEDFKDAKKRQFNTITAVESIEHWADVAHGLETVRRHLAPGGLFVLSTPNRDSLHARIGRKLGLDVPYCSHDHTHEFGHDELLSTLMRHGFHPVASQGVFLMPWWALEGEFGTRIRELTDSDPELLAWLLEAGRGVPHLAFIQCHALCCAN